MIAKKTGRKSQKATSKRLSRTVLERSVADLTQRLERQYELARAIAACTAPHEDQTMTEFNVRTVFQAQMETSARLGRRSSLCLDDFRSRVKPRRRAGSRSPGALTCAKLGRFVQGDASELSGRKMKSYPAFARVRGATTTAQKKFPASSGGTSKVPERFS